MPRTRIYKQPTPIFQAQPHKVEPGDLVQHKVFDYLNSGQPFRVLETHNQQALCTYPEAGQTIITWYDKADLKVIQAAKEELYEDDEYEYF